MDVARCPGVSDTQSDSVDAGCIRRRVGVREANCDKCSQNTNRNGFGSERGWENCIFRCWIIDFQAGRSAIKGIIYNNPDEIINIVFVLLF